jgi:signal peptidase I
MNKSRKKPTHNHSRAVEPARPATQTPSGSSSFFSREVVESIVVAIVLALLFRTFEAEAFVIPTGSMAPTLQGRHKDVRCAKCGYRYQGGASLDNELSKKQVIETTCPMCRYPMTLEPGKYLNQQSFTGDRILVNKFAFQLGEPERWDVIVFKYPGNAKQNYIKRLIGLPGETVRIRHGDIFIAPNNGDVFEIARKPPRKLLAMLHTVHDTDYIPQQLIRAGWPARWSQMDAASASAKWTASEDRQTYSLQAGASDTINWLGYQHIVPGREAWTAIENGQSAGGDHRGQLISDFYAYNACIHAAARYEESVRSMGFHWVGDLGLEARFELSGEPGGILYLELIEGGHHHQCQIDTSSGRATLRIDQGRIPFIGNDGQTVPELRGDTRLVGPGRYRVRLTNVDDQLRLWVNNRLISFGQDAATDGIYFGDDQSTPTWSSTDPGDLIPLRLGAQGIDVKVTNLRVLRDVYYVATDDTGSGQPAVDYDIAMFSPSRLAGAVSEVFMTPEDWSSTRLFDSRRSVDFQLRMDAADPSRDQFFPLGDNSPQSKDARLWHEDGSFGTPLVEPSVERRLLTGKAFFIYWPHPWYFVIPQQAWIPNPMGMGLIR